MKTFKRFYHKDIFSLTNFALKHLKDYPTPTSLNYFWGFGSLIGIFLVIQIISGILLAMHYTPIISLAFISVEHIMRDVNNGWFLRYVHANGASFVFIGLYLHLFKGLYYSSYIYPYNLLWITGVILFILMMATAFMGYILPFGQMSFWGATVIINLFSAIPYIGSSIVYWLLGGYAVENATLNRFFSLHFFLPFIIAGFTLVHLTLLHYRGSSNPLGLSDSDDQIPFYPYFYLKDFLGLILYLFFFFFIVFYYPNVLGHSDNYIEANALVTPLHIVPEWYFLPFYAILRSIPNKLGGVICMGLALVILLILPFIVKITEFHILKFKYKYFQYDNNNFFYYNHLKSDIKKKLPMTFFIKGPKFRLLYTIFFWFFVFNLIYLGYIGGSPVEEPYIFLGQFSTFFYFFYFIIFIPFCIIFENKMLFSLLKK